MRGSICSCHQTPQMPRSHSFSTWPVWSAPRIMGTLCLIKYHDSDTYHHSALRRETFFAPLQKKESLSSSLILLRVAQASRAKMMNTILAQVWPIPTIVKPAHDFTSSHGFIGAGFYLDATNPKYALHYNMRTHIQLEIPQVLEISGLPIVRPCHLFLSPP